MIDDGVILRSQANLVAARGADLGRGRARASPASCSTASPRRRAPAQFREVRTRFKGCDDALLAEARERFGVASPFGGPTSSGMLTLHCPPARVHALATFLRDKGAENVVVADIGYVFSRTNALYAKLEAALA